MRVGAVIVNYNAGAHLLDCIDSLKAEQLDQIVVVDNGSSDGSPESAVKAHPDIALIRLPNPGFGAANNVGVKELDTELVLLANPDTVFAPGALALMKEKLLSGDRIGVVGPCINNTDGSRYPSARRFPSFVDGTGHALVGAIWKNNPWTRRYKMDDTDNASSRSVDWVGGAAMLLRREAFDEVNGFDPGYFMYLEDTDLCWRLHKAGWDVVYEPAATIVHVQGVSTAPQKPRMIRAHHRSLMRYYAHNSQGIDRLLTPLILIGTVSRMLVALGVCWVRKQIAVGQAAK